LQNLRAVEFGPGLLALGSCAHTTSPSLIWVSPDGHIWQVSAPKALAHADVYSLLAADGLVVATGQDTTNGFAAASWASHDGLSWTRSTGDLGCGVMSQVARLGSEFVAFGNKTPDAPEVDVPPGVCEWVSPDGIAWQPVALPDKTFPASAGISSIAAGAGGLVAVGSVAGPTQSAAAAWSSPDGRAWTRLATGIPAGWISLDVVLPGGPGYVALGTDGSGNSVLATSADGLAWTPTPVPEQGVLEGGPSIASGSAGVVLAGFSTNGDPTTTMVWSSTDAVQWQPAPAPPPALNYLSVAAPQNTVVLAAATASGGATLVRLGP
jgi:hypothetical protein